MDEANSLSDDIAIIDHGKLIERGTPDALLKKYFDDVIMQLPESAFPHPPITHDLQTEGLQIKALQIDGLRVVDQRIKRLLKHKVSLKKTLK